MTQQEIQSKYEEFYNEALANAPQNEVKIGIESSEGTKIFTERNFYWCGFNNINFKAVGKNRELHKFSKRKAYPSGFCLQIDSIGNRGNGDYEIQSTAYSKLASWLNGQGYDVWHESRLD